MVAVQVSLIMVLASMIIPTSISLSLAAPFLNIVIGSPETISLQHQGGKFTVQILS